MRKIIAILIVCLASLSGMWTSAQNLEFMGVDLCGSNADAVGVALEEKGYKYIGASESAWQFVGVFAGYDAQISLYVHDDQEED